MSKSQSTEPALASLSLRLWRVIAKALGEKAHHHNRVADQVAFVRLLILGSYMITNTLICAGVLRHWND